MIRVGVGGWTFEPWDQTFYPAGLPKTRQLAYAAERLTAIEVNGTYYRTQTPATYAKWASEVPDGFVFTLKALRYTTNRKVLAEAGESVGKFLGSGLTELGDRLGPIVWQFAPTKRFEPDDFAAFLAVLPDAVDGVRLRHAVEVRHDSFRDARFVELCAARGAAIVFAESDEYPGIADPTSDFIYARLQRSRDIPGGYPPDELDRWARIARAWERGETVEELVQVAPRAAVPAKARDVFCFFIGGEKQHNPAAAIALMGRLIA